MYKLTEGLDYMFCTCMFLVYAEVLLELGERFSLTIFFFCSGKWLESCCKF